MDCRVKPGNDEAFSRRIFSPELCQASPTNQSQSPDLRQMTSAVVFPAAITIMLCT
jgi:hypothetical protein